MISREQYIANILPVIGSPYRWGSWGKDGRFDCSGLVCYAMKFSAKMNAKGLRFLYKGREIPPKQAAPGSLYFYGNSDEDITHVMTVLTHWDNGGITLVGARGGDSTVLNDDNAKEKGAFVDVCFETYWQDRLLCAVDPF